MANTPALAIPYCGPNDRPDVPYWMQRLAERAEALLQAQDRTTKADKAPMGVVARNTNPVANNVNDSTWIMFDMAAVTLVKDRWYRATYRFNTSSAAGVNVALGNTLRTSATAVVDATGTTVDGDRIIWTAPAAASGKSEQSIFIWKAPASGTFNIKACANRSVGTGQAAYDQRSLTVEDLGQNL